jgi:mutator protein MutT
MPHVVVAGLLCSDRRALLCHRAPGRRWYPDVWDFPGGHVEPGERADHALKRELYEELGVKINTATGSPIIHRRDTSTDLDLRVWRIDSWSGEITNRQPAEHDAIDWFSRDQLQALRLADPSYLTVLQRVLAAAPN